MNSALSQTADVVCLVDDDASIRRSITRMLKLDGVGVRAFGEAEGFLAYLGANAVRLAILDIWMKPMTCLELLAHVCARSPQTCVIFITAQEDEAAELTVKRAGAYAFFMKLGNGSGSAQRATTVNRDSTADAVEGPGPP
jgi:FixJ family two-component response regulator